MRREKRFWSSGTYNKYGVYSGCEKKSHKKYEKKKKLMTNKIRLVKRSREREKISTQIDKNLGT